MVPSTPRTLCTALLAFLVAGPAASATITRISLDPFTNTDSQHATEVEPDTFAFGSTIVSAFQTGRFFDGGSSDIGFSTSRNGGATWVHGFLPSVTVNSVPAGPYARVSDPAVAYDAKHDAWLIASLGISSGGNGLAVLVSRSVDGGRTWAAPVAVSTTTGFYDKTWIACDNTTTSAHYGNCYATWDDANAGDLLQASTSPDGGLTWGPKKGALGNAYGLGGQPLVRPGGQVVVPALSAFSNDILAYGSSDGGTSWTAATVVSNVTDHGVAGGLRSEPLPSAEIDAAGTVYVAWQDCRFRVGCASNDIVMSTSANGTTWSAPVRIPIDPVSSTVDHFIPGLAVDRTTSGATARMALTYYFYPDRSCTASTCQLSVGIVSSIDGGASWSSPLTLAGPMRIRDLANTSQGYMVGDYQSASFSGANAVPVFALARRRNGTALKESMFTTQVPVTAAESYPQVLVDDLVLSLQGDRAAGTRHVLILP